MTAGQLETEVDSWRQLKECCVGGTSLTNGNAPQMPTWMQGAGGGADFSLSRGQDTLALMLTSAELLMNIVYESFSHSFGAWLVKSV